MIKNKTFVLAITVAATVAVGFILAPSNIDPAHKHSWGENIGWMNWLDAGGGADGVYVGSDHLSGYIWGENAGWIDVGDGTAPYANTTGSNFGVNILPGGDLDGYAWSENAGWINFSWAAGTGNADRARFDSGAGRFRGHAWGENAGWINLDDPTHYVAAEVLAPVDPPTEPEGEAAFDKNRYISLVPANPGQQTALRVTLTSLPSEFSAYEDTYVWVSEPIEVCENSGQDDQQAPDNCGVAWIGGPVLTMWSANLQAGQYCHDFGSVGLLHVTDCEIVPGGTYTVQAIDCTADPGNEANYSDPLVINTSSWGNICGPWDAGNDRWSAPDTSVDIVFDVTACVDKFKNAFGAPIKPRADIDPNVPDWKINITSDVTKILDAFGGDPYPFAGPGTCPP